MINTVNMLQNTLVSTKMANTNLESQISPDMNTKVNCFASLKETPPWEEKRSHNLIHIFRFTINWMTWLWLG